MCMSGARGGQKIALDPRDWNLSCGHRGLNLGLLEEQPMVLTGKPSLQHQKDLYTTRHAITGMCCVHEHMCSLGGL